MATILGDVQYTQVMGHLTTPDQGAAVMSHDVVGEASTHPILTYLVMESESLASRCEAKGNSWKTQWIGLRENFNGKPLYLMGKTMVSG